MHYLLLITKPGIFSVSLYCTAPPTHTRTHTHTLLGHISLGALGDSFYEYLLKSWLVTNKKDIDGRDMFYDALNSIDKHLVKRTSNGLIYLTDLKNGKPDNKMQHLVSSLLSKSG